VGALEFVPFLLFGLIVGVYADRWDRRRILLVADLVRFVMLASVPLAAFFPRVDVRAALPGGLHCRDRPGVVRGRDYCLPSSS
jgi:MFS family permease